jgi:protease IV
MSEKKVGFGRVFWPSLVAALIVSVLGSIIFVLIVGGFISGLSDMKAEPMSINEKTVLHLTLDGDVAEKTDAKFNKSQLNFSNSVGLSDLLYGFQTAKSDKKVSGIFIDLKGAQFGYATAKELRDAINDFEKSGKFVVAYNSGEMISQKEYYLSSAANFSYAFPTSAMEFIGLGAELMYFKNTLDKLGVEMQVIRGKNNDFKSAVEPFFRENMSDSSRVQIERYLNSMWLSIRKDISNDRKVSVNELNQIAENITIHRAQDAVKYKLIDKVMYRDEVIELIEKKAGVEKGKLKLVSFEKFAKKKFKQNQILIEAEKPNVAVILSQGDITTDGDGITSKEICKLFQDVRANKSIKTVVFRVNSPGGSALASDEIWREVKLTNKVKKVIVSMGDVAASGGYYIATPATRIFAESKTITGSIGVFGVIPFIGDMLTDKLGLTFDRATTNKHAVLSLNKKLSSEELSYLQDEVDLIYKEFLSRVAEGRGMSVEQVNAIARGRVWAGEDALKIGLVDEIGGIDKAIAYASKLAGLSKPKVLYYPLQKEDPFGELIEKIQEEEFAQSESKSSVSEELMHYYERLKLLDQLSGIQMRLPLYIDFN